MINLIFIATLTLTFSLWAYWTAKKNSGVVAAVPDEEAIKQRYGHVLREMERKPFNFDRVFESFFRNIYNENSFVDGQYFYITFRKDGLELPRQIMRMKGDNVTVVLQHQFYDLSIDSTGFTVTLVFNRKRETITIPFKNIEILSDPSIGFAIQRVDLEQLQ